MKKTEIEVVTGKKKEKTNGFPETTIQPSNGRIICYKVPVKEVELSSGIVAPGSFGNDPNKEQKILHHNRYFVLAAASDCPLKVNEGGKERALERGDELLIAMNQEATAFNFPQVTDYGHPNAPKFDSVHFTEVDGVFPTKKITVE